MTKRGATEVLSGPAAAVFNLPLGVLEDMGYDAVIVAWPKGQPNASLCIPTHNRPVAQLIPEAVEALRAVERGHTGKGLN